MPCPLGLLGLGSSLSRLPNLQLLKSPYMRLHVTRHTPRAMQVSGHVAARRGLGNNGGKEALPVWSTDAPFLTVLRQPLARLTAVLPTASAPHPGEAAHQGALPSLGVQGLMGRGPPGSG